MNSDQEYNIHFNYTSWLFGKYNTTTTSALRTTHFAPMESWPAQSLTSAGRQGKSIKNVTATFKILVKFYGWLNKANPAATDIIPWMNVRIIVFTLNDNQVVTSSITDFWRQLDNAAPMEYLRVNRTKVTVLYDKITQFRNDTPYAVNSNPPAKSVVDKPTLKTKTITVKRRWNNVTFPSETATNPADPKKITYIAVIPMTEYVNLTIADHMVNTAILMNMYYNA